MQSHVAAVKQVLQKPIDKWCLVFEVLNVKEKFYSVHLFGELRLLRFPPGNLFYARSLVSSRIRFEIILASSTPQFYLRFMYSYRLGGFPLKYSSDWLPHTQDLKLFNSIASRYNVSIEACLIFSLRGKSVIFYCLLTYPKTRSTVTRTPDRFSFSCSCSELKVAILCGTANLGLRRYATYLYAQYWVSLISKN